ncbi:hypothetical protein D3C73_1057220 [compost metagenome]
MALQRVGVARPLVTEQVTERCLPLGVCNQSIPVIMADFVPKMPEQRAIGFVHMHPHLFAMGVVGLLDIQGNQAIGVADGGRFPFEVDADEVEGKSRRFIFGPGDNRQPQIDQLGDQSALGCLDLAPAFVILRNR